MSQSTAPHFPYRSISSGMGQAVAERTVLRKKESGEYEHWGDVADRVAFGNASLFDGPIHTSIEEYQLLRKHIANGNTLMSGRHLQHGDALQNTRNMEVFTNCGHVDTKLITLEHGITTFGDTVGTTVTVRCSDGGWRSATVKKYGKQMLYNLTFQRCGTGPATFREERFTRNHRWILSDGSVTDSIQVGDILCGLPVESEKDPRAIVHGLIFGDGSAHKSRNDKYRKVSQGREYCSLRVCKQDSVREEIESILTNAGYERHTPESADGDPVFYIGKFPYAKEVPFTRDPSYIAGFIYGWWLADGSKTEANGTWTISTSDDVAANWLLSHSVFAGLTVLSHRKIDRTDGDGSYPNGKSLHVVRMKAGVTWKLASIEPFVEETVYCVEEPVTKSFTLASGLLTGNCATSSTSFLLFYLLLNGSGVGRCYDDDMILVNWDHAPNLRCVLDSSHPDFNYSAHESLRDAQHKYGFGSDTKWFEVPDSREGWAKALELWENSAWEKIHANKMLILDFSKVRPKGSPINGMQNRPASGPVALMDAFNKAASLKGAGLAPWKQAMYLDHYFAECVLVGGARRAARMSTKHWSDETVFDFVTIKRPIEFRTKSVDEIITLRSEKRHDPFLWSSNNSVTVDEEFWALVRAKGDKSPRAKHAKKVFRTICEAAYADGTGEPGFINSHMLVQKDEGWTDLNRGDYVGSAKYQLNDDTQILMSRLAKRAKKKKYHTICNPCGEIALNVLGGFCVEKSTRIAHRSGSDRIIDLVGKTVEVFNGEEWSEVTPFQTGVGQQLVRVTLSDGSYLDCTPYHRFSVKHSRQAKHFYERTAAELQPGDILPTFRLPNDIAGQSESEAYTYGAFLGDGSIELRNDTNNFRYTIGLYQGKHHLPVTGTRGTETNNGCIDVTVSHLDQFKLHSMKQNSLPDWVFQLDRTSTEQFLMGLFDTDGGFNQNTGGIYFDTTNEQVAYGVQLLLRRFGCSFASVNKTADAGDLTNFGPRNKPLFRVYVPASEAGLIVGHRVASDYELDLNHCVKQPRVVSVVPIDGLHDTYCFTEPKRGMGVFGNMLTFQCVIADVVPYHADTLEEAEECFRVTARALMRVNLMDSIYNKEVKRTNRIGVGMTGVHEFAYKFFGYGFKELIDEEKSKDFWLTLARFNRAVHEEVLAYAAELGVNPPHTETTIKPAGTTSKLFLLTEGWHLPSMREFLRWVQFRNDDPLVQTYKAAGYPVRELVQYQGTTIVGFPTAPTITTLGMGDKLMTAAEASPEEQFKWLMLGEKYWIVGTDENGVPVSDAYGNQISYTLKYKPDVTDFKHFKDMILKYQSQVRCASVMPQDDVSSYEYQPEQPVSSAEFAEIVSRIEEAQFNKLVRITEEVGREHVDCAGGACPIDFKTDAKT